MGNGKPVDETVYRATQEGSPESYNTLRFTPPLRDGGIDKMSEFLSAIHSSKSSSILPFMGSDSETTFFEIHYENESMDFYFQLPTDELESRYRNQLSGEFDGIELEDIKKVNRKFPEFNGTQYYAATSLCMKQHFYNPIGMDDSRAKSYDEPYRAILNEIDTKDQMKAVVQIGYKPVPESWNRTYGMGSSRFINRLKEEGVVDEKLFGLAKERVDDSSMKLAEQITEKANQLAFAVCIRIVLCDKSKTRVEKRVEEVTDQFVKVYESTTGQGFTTRGNDSDTILAHTINRTAPKSPPRLFCETRLKLRLKKQPYMIFSTNELAEIAYLPSGNDIDVAGISWSNDTFSGTLPPEADNWTPIPDDKKENLEVI